MGGTVSASAAVISASSSIKGMSKTSSVDLLSLLQAVKDVNGDFSKAVQNIQLLRTIDVDKAFSNEEDRTQYKEVQNSYMALLKSVGGYCHSRQTAFCTLAALHKECMKLPEAQRKDHFLNGFKKIFTAKEIQESYDKVFSMLEEAERVMRTVRDLMKKVGSTRHQALEALKLVGYAFCLAVTVGVAIYLIAVPGGVVLDAVGISLFAGLGLGAFSSWTSVMEHWHNLRHLRKIPADASQNLQDMDTHCMKLKTALFTHHQELAHMQNVDIAVDLDRIPDLVKSFDDLLEAVVQPMKTKKA